jgi:hypothetical protein
MPMISSLFSVELGVGASDAACGEAVLADGSPVLVVLLGGVPVFVTSVVGGEVLGFVVLAVIAVLALKLDFEVVLTDVLGIDVCTISVAVRVS